MPGLLSLNWCNKHEISVDLEFGKDGAGDDVVPQCDDS